MDYEIKDMPAPRIPLQMDIRFRRSYARSPEDGILKNISLTGAFLKTPLIEELQPKDKLTITFNVSGRERTLHATVVWNSNDGCGIKFKPFNNRDVQIVDDLMYFVENSRDSQRSILDSIFKKVS